MIPLFLAVATATTSLFASGGARIHPSNDTAAGGAQVGLTQSIWGSEAYALVLEVDAAFVTAERSFPQGDVRLFLVSGEIAAEARQDFASLSLGIGPRLELGWGAVRGRASSTEVVENRGEGLIVAASLGISLRVPFTRSFGLSVLAEAGLTLRGLEAVVDGASTTGWRGPFISTNAGFWLDL